MNINIEKLEQIKGLHNQYKIQSANKLVGRVNETWRMVMVGDVQVKYKEARNILGDKKPQEGMYMIPCDLVCPNVGHKKKCIENPNDLCCRRYVYIIDNQR